MTCRKIEVMRLKCAVAAALILLSVGPLESVLPNGECEVCVGFLDKFYTHLKEKNADFTPSNIEKELIAACSNAKGKENRLCYYLGATTDAAAKITGEVTRPMSAHIPVPKICEKLKKMDFQICELRYEKNLDLNSVDLSKLRVAELKNILDRWGEVCIACFEKTDYVNLIKELMPKYTSGNKDYRFDL
ncbi:cerebral dopamine neurotrophic factor-like [Protopterus annectens]|uniref:cerebral dopamine neurotrophic factor-like n=1 Tax=Protopterus annectens TaxID=7888 RepID=UPI001CFB5956|nr:cerebral dopamine neurotrophic factor-like [Protopterus annectens]